MRGQVAGGAGVLSELNPIRPTRGALEAFMKVHDGWLWGGGVLELGGGGEGGGLL
jgi:hypothetical protein